MWPLPVPVLGVTGPVASGKTTFLLSINPYYELTKYWDFELSGVSHVATLPGFVEGVNYFNVAKEMAKEFPDGHEDYELWRWWRQHILEQCKPGDTKLALTDPISELEESLVSDIWKRPNHYNTTHNKLANATGLVWGIMKSEWKRVLSNLAGRVETYGFSSHQAAVYAGGKPVPGKKKPKGKETLWQLATIYMELNRKDEGDEMAPPSAKMLKNRLSIIRPDALGNPLPHQVVPPFLKVAKPSVIRWYMKHPVGLRPKLAADEVLHKEETTELDKQEMELALLEARKEADQVRLEALQLQDRMGQQRRKLASSGNTATAHRPPPQAEPANGQQRDGGVPALTRTDALGRAKTYVEAILKRKIMSPAAIKESIRVRGGSGVSFSSLKTPQLIDLVSKLADKVPDVGSWGIAPSQE